MLKNNKKTIAVIAISLTAISVLCAIFLHAYMGTFSRYIADDYCVVGAAKLRGFIQTQIYWRLTWTGRYSYNFFETLYGFLGDKFPAILPALSLLLWVLSAFYFVKQVTRRLFAQTNNLIILVISSLFIFLMLYSIPQVGEDIYWMTGITNYLFPIIIELFLLGFVIKSLSVIEESPLFTKSLYLFSFFILSFINSGFSEIAGALNVTIFGIFLLTAIAFKIKKKLSTTKLLIFGILFLGAFVGFLFMMIAVGNTIRGGSLIASGRPSLIELFSNAFLLSAKYSIKWLLNYSYLIWPICTLLCFFGIYVPLNSNIFVRNPKKNQTLLMFGYLLFCGLLVFVSFIPTYWTGHRAPPDRALIFPISILSWVSISISFMLGYYLREKITISESKSNILHIVMIVLCAYFIVSIPLNYARHYYSTNISSQIKYAQKWDQENEIILEAINNGQEIISTSKIYYTLMDLETITGDPNNWVNICAAEYYQVKEIIAH